MEKFARCIELEGINERIEETLKGLGYSNVEYLDDFCNENDFELVIKTLSYKPHEVACEVGYNDADTSENICDALQFLYECNYADDDYLLFDLYISCNNELEFIETLDIKDYTSLTIVNGYGIETEVSDADFVDAVVYKIDESLNNHNLQETALYKSIFKSEEDTENEDKYNLLVDKVLKSVKHFMYSDSKQMFNVDCNHHYISCYLFYKVPSIKDYYIDDICDVLEWRDR